MSNLNIMRNAKRFTPSRRRDLLVSLLLALFCLLIYNANLRSIPAADTLSARYLPFSILKHHTVSLDPISAIVAQGWQITKVQGRSDSAFWIALGREDRLVSLYPIVVPVLI